MLNVQKQVEDKLCLRQNAFVSSTQHELLAPLAMKQCEQQRAAEDAVVWSS